MGASENEIHRNDTFLGFLFDIQLVPEFYDLYANNFPSGSEANVVGEFFIWSMWYLSAFM